MEQTIPSAANGFSAIQKSPPSPFFMKPDVSLQGSQQPPYGCYSPPRLPVHFLKIPFNIILPTFDQVFKTVSLVPAFSAEMISDDGETVYRLGFWLDKRRVLVQCPTEARGLSGV
jgi:hypothetical protein